jgi:hypothetical protein
MCLDWQTLHNDVWRSAIRKTRIVSSPQPLPLGVGLRRAVGLIKPSARG